MAQNSYDQPDFFAGYSQFRRSLEGLAGAPEWPTLRDMLPSLQGRRVLDLGCGFGAFARSARAAGAVHVLGIDLSERMLERAQSLTTDATIEYRKADIETLALPGASFDVVFSSLALHYIENCARVCATVRRLLTPGGAFVFSVEHPLLTAPANPGWQTDSSGAPVWPVNDYLHEGQRVTDWITTGVVKQHRTVARHVNDLVDHGFRITRLVEWRPDAAQLAANPEWAKEVHRPMFLLVGARL
jgi:ubiquinone/menaquinone biosynthesis C-methylase UbiE